jgi:hypothetical protein
VVICLLPDLPAGRPPCLTVIDALRRLLRWPAGRGPPLFLRAKKALLPEAPAADAPPVSSYDDTVWIICVYYHPTAIRHHNRGP